MAQKQRKQIKLNKVLGVTKDGEIIAAQYIFFDTLHGQEFNGVTGSTFRALTQEEIDERNDLENVIDSYGYLWQEAVKDGNTTESQEDYIQGIIDAEVSYGDAYFLGHDTSYIYELGLAENEQLKEIFPDAVTFECVSGGRCFPGVLNDLEHVFEPELIKQILEIEKK